VSIKTGGKMLGLLSYLCLGIATFLWLVNKKGRKGGKYISYEMGGLTRIFDEADLNEGPHIIIGKSKEKEYSYHYKGRKDYNIGVPAYQAFLCCIAVWWLYLGLYGIKISVDWIMSLGAKE
jgi:hypothetical protein